MYNFSTSRKYRFLATLLVFSLATILAGKVLFVSKEYPLLYVYGISVTLVLLVTFCIALFMYKDPVEAARQHLLESGLAFKRPKPKVSCMVAVYNEEMFVERCIQSLVGQTYRNKEIIFVNDKSTDGTAAILDRYAKQSLIKVIHLKKNVGKKRALGHAMRIAKGSLFAFSDSDSIWKTDAIERIVDVFRVYRNVGAVSGHGRALNAQENFLTRVQDSWYEGQFGVRKAFESVFGAVTCVSGPLAVFRREAIYNYIPAWEQDSFLGQEFRFATDRTLTAFVLGSAYVGREVRARYTSTDHAMNNAYRDRDWRIVYAKSARSWTLVPNTWSSMLKQQIRWKKSFIRNMFFTGSFFWHKPLLPSLFYYLHIVFVLVGPLIAFRHLVYMPINGDVYAAVAYLIGIFFIGYMFALAYRIENGSCTRWVYRPFMSVLSTTVFSWLIFYSAVSIRKMVWSRG